MLNCDGALFTNLIYIETAELYKRELGVVRLFIEYSRLQLLCEMAGPLVGIITYLLNRKL